MPQMYHLAYNTLNATLYWLDNSYTINLIVQSRNKNKSGDEKVFITEYPTKNGLSNIYFDLHYYMEIRSVARDLNGQPNTFRIDQTNYFQFMIALENIANWFVGRESIFYKDKNNIIRVKDQSKKNIVIVGPFNAKIDFVLGVRTAQANGQQEPGLFIYINSSDEPIFMDASKFMNFKYFMDRFNMYDAAMQLVIYMGKGKNQDRLVEAPNKKEKTQSFFEAVGATERK